MIYIGVAFQRWRDLLFITDPDLATFLMDRSRPWLKKAFWSLFILLILVPVSLKILPQLVQHFVYTHRIRVPFFVDLGRPADLSLNHTINMYLTSEEGISLGVWHTVPASQWEEAQGKDLVWYQNALHSGSPVFIYLHGNTGTRADPHRVGVAKILSALGYHVLVPDYRGWWTQRFTTSLFSIFPSARFFAFTLIRVAPSGSEEDRQELMCETVAGFADSTGEPTEPGLTTDALFLYKWVKARSGNSLVIVWGHSLGTGVTTNIAVKLIKQGEAIDGVILEGAFNNARQKFGHPFIWYYWKYPGIGYVFREPWAENKIAFPSEENVKKMKSPILFLHSEDDHLTPLRFVQEMRDVAVKAQNAERVKLVTFEGTLGYLHNGLYRDPRLPNIIKEFVMSL